MINFRVSVFWSILFLLLNISCQNKKRQYESSLKYTCLSCSELLLKDENNGWSFKVLNNHSFCLKGNYLVDSNEGNVLVNDFDGYIYLLSMEDGKVLRKNKVLEPSDSTLFVSVEAIRNIYVIRTNYQIIILDNALNKMSEARYNFPIKEKAIW